LILVNKPHYLATYRSIAMIVPKSS
jgi:hypothetical protein